MNNQRPPSQSAKSRTGVLSLRLAASLAVSGLFIWLSLRHTDLEAVIRAMRSAPRLPLLGYFVILLAVHLVRTVRWGLLLEPAGHVGFKRVNSASAIGFMLLMVLPLRLGELARPLLVARTTDGRGSQLRRSAAMASCIVERVVDGLALAALGIVALRFLGATGPMADFARRASLVVGAAFLGLCLGLIVAVVTRQQTADLIRRVITRVAPARADAVVAMVGGFLDALNFGSVGRGAAVIGLTVVHWGLHVVGFTILAPAFGMHLTPLMASAVLAAQAVGVMVPAGPGMVGTSQFFTQAGLSIFIPGALTVGDVAARAAAYANTIWMLQFTQQVSLGLLFWFGGRVSLAGLVGAHIQDRKLPAGLAAGSSISV
jgi:glycosyltransferase 2 family protein